MNANSIRAALALLAAIANPDLFAQQPTPPAPAAKTAVGAGVLNDFLHDYKPAFTNWDIGGQVRARFESKSGFAVPGAGANAVDFSQLTPDNNYWLLREKTPPRLEAHFVVEPLRRRPQQFSYNYKRTPEPEEDVD